MRRKKVHSIGRASCSKFHSLSLSNHLRINRWCSGDPNELEGWCYCLSIKIVHPSNENLADANSESEFRTTILYWPAHYFKIFHRTIHQWLPFSLQWFHFNIFWASVAKTERSLFKTQYQIQFFFNSSFFFKAHYLFIYLTDFSNLCGNVLTRLKYTTY